MTQIITNRLIIRDVASDDAEPNARLWSDPAVMRYMGGPRDYHWILEETPKIVSAQAGQDTGIWSVVEKTSLALVGNCGLVQKKVNGKDECELVYLFFSAVWGRGYATEAANGVQEHGLSRLGLPRVVALIDPGNIPSERVALRIGMHNSGDVVRPDGRSLRLYVSQRGAPNAEPRGDGG